MKYITVGGWEGKGFDDVSQKVIWKFVLYICTTFCK